MGELSWASAVQRGRSRASLTPQPEQLLSPEASLLFFWLIPSFSRCQQKDQPHLNANPHSKAPAEMEREEIKDVLNTSGVSTSHLRSPARQTEKGKVLQVPLQVPVQGRELGSSREGINLPSHIAYVITEPQQQPLGFSL